MSTSNQDIPKSRGRPKTTGRGTAIVVRCHDEQLAPLDAWIANRPEPKPSRPEAIRTLIGNALSRDWEPLVIKIKQAQYDALHDWLKENLANHTKYFDKHRDQAGDNIYVVKVWAEPNDLFFIKMRWC